MKSFYESAVTWKEDVNHLRCSPEFNHQARYDCVIVMTDDGPIIAQLKFAFTVVVNEEAIPVILVQAFDAYSNPKFKKKDRDLGLVRLRQRPVEKVEFFFARSIVRGAVVFPAYDDEKDSILFDILDTDMFLRSRQM